MLNSNISAVHGPCSYLRHFPCHSEHSSPWTSADIGNLLVSFSHRGSPPAVPTAAGGCGHFFLFFKKTIKIYEKTTFLVYPIGPNFMWSHFAPTWSHLAPTWSPCTAASRPTYRHGHHAGRRIEQRTKRIHDFLAAVSQLPNSSPSQPTPQGWNATFFFVSRLNCCVAVFAFFCCSESLL